MQRSSRSRRQVHFWLDVADYSVLLEIATRQDDSVSSVLRKLIRSRIRQLSERDRADTEPLQLRRSSQGADRSS